MGKPRCKQLRKITVGGVEYKWLVEKIDSGIHETPVVHLKIWDNSKQIFFNKDILRYDTIRQVTPYRVKTLILYLTED